jgi:Ca2+-binding EF-hand superfamily protein
LDEFKKVIRDLKIDITNSESELIFDVFDPDSTNLISYSEMIHTFKGNVPPKRAEFFERVWNTVKVSEEHTTFSQIRHSLNFKGHPDIQTGRRYDDEILK